MKQLITLMLILTASTVSAGIPIAKNKKAVEIFGSVYDAFTKGKLKAFITLMRSDSTVVDTATCYVSERGTYSWYSFYVPRTEARYILKATLEGYKDSYMDYELKNIGRKYQTGIPCILMSRKDDGSMRNINLDGVVVTGTRVQIAYKGDTIVYDAAAFNMPEGSMLDGLIRQMPGAEIKDNGDIYVNGRKIDNLLLNGKDFFKGDNKMMLDNLPYFTVKDVRVYHKTTEKSELAGREIEKKDYVMDVSLKREYARGYVVNSEVGAGTQKRWMGRAFGLYYDDHTRVSVFGNMNNVNEDRRPGSDGEWTPSDMPRGLLTTRQAGFNLRTEDKDRNIRENADVALTWKDADNTTKAASETFASAGNIYKGSSSASRNRNFYLSMNNTLSFSKLRLTLHTHGYCSNGDNASSRSDSTYGAQLMNSSYSRSMSEYSAVTLNQRMYWYKSFEWGDYISFNASVNYSHMKPGYGYGFSNTFYSATGETDRRNTFSEAAKNRYSYYGEAQYALVLPSRWEIGSHLYYEQRYNRERNNHYRLDLLNNERYEEQWLLPSTRDSLLSVLDGANSRFVSTMEREYRATVSLSRYTDNGSINIVMPLIRTNERMHYMRTVLDTVARRSYTTFEPYASIHTYGKNPVSFRYELDVAQPDFQNLMPATDNRNPLSVRLNNPGLKGRIRHKGNGQVTFKNDSTGASFYVGFDFLVLHNAWGNRTTYDSSTGAYTYMTDNVNGCWSSSLKGGWQRPLDRKKLFRIDLNGSVKYERSVDFDVAYDTDADVLSKVTNVYTRLNGKVSYRRGKFSAAVVSKLVMRNSRGNREGMADINTYDYQYGGNLQYAVPGTGITVATDINMFSRRGYGSDMMNTDDIVWNAQLTHSFMKGRFTAKLQVFDLLHQLSSVRYNINAQGRTETWYNCIPRYVMLTAAYKFVRKPNKK